MDKNTPRIPLTPFTELTFPSRVRAVFLDLDGTLLDSMGVWSDIDRRFLAKRGLDIPRTTSKRSSPSPTGTPPSTPSAGSV